MKTVVLAVAVLSFCTSPLRCLAQTVAPVIYLSASEQAKARQVTQEVQTAQSRKFRAAAAWQQFYQAYQAAHPELPAVAFTSDFRFAYSGKEASDDFWSAMPVAVSQLSGRERHKAKSLYSEVQESYHALVKAQKDWYTYQTEFLFGHVTAPSAGCNGTIVTLNGKSKTICNPWSNGVAFISNFRVAVPRFP
ncbi:MAG: hypothetical protein KGM47_02600 [Acidobacteriota bacterium]|nr:hypothetical protein [Acidobacteriota bacterium]